MANVDSNNGAKINYDWLCDNFIKFFDWELARSKEKWLISLSLSGKIITIFNVFQLLMFLLRELQIRKA